MSVTLLIIILTVIISYMAFRNEELFDRFKFNAYHIDQHKSYYRFLSYGLLHVDWMHLFVNMFVLFSFGQIVEEILLGQFGFIGRFFLLLLYVLGLIASVIPAFFKHRNNHNYNSVGASGAVSAVLFSSIILYPEGSIYLFLLPIPIPAFIFGILYLIYSAYMSKKANDNVGHDAHFWGAVFGVLFTIVLEPAFFTRFINHVL
ncbi:MAG: rhomboid family intramembrane serine protease [Bacteroidales bacterium]